MLLSLLSSSVLLKTRLAGPAESDSPTGSSDAGLPMAIVQMIASLAAIAVGFYGYYTDMKALKNMRAFLVATK